MTTADYSTVLQKMRSLMAEVDVLRAYAKWTRKEFLSDGIKRSAAERRLQVSIESCLDIARLIVSLEDMRVAGSDEGALEILVSKGVIPPKLFKKLIGARGLRNLLVHEYGKIDAGKIYQHLRRDREDLVAFAQHIARYLDTPR